MLPAWNFQPSISDGPRTSVMSLCTNSQSALSGGKPNSNNEHDRCDKITIECAYLPRAFQPSFSVLRHLLLLRPSEMLNADDFPRWFLLRSSTDKEELFCSMLPTVTWLQWG